jgi:hypothetical protein
MRTGTPVLGRRHYGLMALAQRSAGRPATVRVRVVPPGGTCATVERSDLLTPYAMEEIAEDALHAGRGAWLDLALSTGTSAVDVARIRERLARLDARGVRISIHQLRGR